MNKTGRKMIMLKSIDVCCMAWYIIHGVSRLEFHRQTSYAKEGGQSHNHENNHSSTLPPMTQQGRRLLKWFFLTGTNRKTSCWM
jgi:hypothetical protein